MHLYLHLLPVVSAAIYVISLGYLTENCSFCLQYAQILECESFTYVLKECLGSFLVSRNSLHNCLRDILQLKLTLVKQSKT